ncbi:FAD-dependent oxidoreductase [Burkholderia pseudomallei]|uniref:NAD(P)/FAD-dependent oxidoreductase n=1 Tax=Burkholderia pseudomallei TaxID=28450 RepID=UPI0003D7BF9D|nr:FAD-binding oxidoreductase [Burkholderia pseudomallei]AHE35358.1 FAD binding domain protein [Burkholderia pseudomallei NAU20B-16]AHG36828.1 FAD binding domain protein [Burkholderia pseudomallei MSHR511]AHG71764.1 FAD binding domain protein [Burkholderia pseudomallei MSHR146]OMX08532.1 FAD-dependent oxidoreductase [Burkholderia pseudomallei]OMY02555.1 FAD-dependent oxidoreductase [Burkholderia pseudomallei]
MQNYYEATVTRTPYPALAERIDTDVCIVGGGLAGLSTALGLVERGVRDIALLDAQTVGFGASGRNGGFVFGGYSLDNADLLRTLGPESARALYRLTIDAVELIRARAARYGIDCELVDGGVILANWFDDPARLCAPRKLMKEAFGVDWEPLDERELRTRLKTDRYRGGLFERNAFHFHPLKYVLGVAAAAAQGGARIHEHSAARAIRRDGAGFVVATDGGAVRARRVVFAGGGYARGVYPRIERAVLPIATYVIATEPLGARLADAIACEAAVYDTRFAFDYYRPLADTRILWGGRISVLERGPEAIARLLRRDLLRVYPQLRDVAVQFAWGGLMSYARHKMPQIGRDAHGIWHAVGFGGHGMAPTTVAGEVLAAALAGERPVPDGFARFGLARTFGLAGLAAAQLTYSAYEARDALAARRCARAGQPFRQRL